MNTETKHTPEFSAEMQPTSSEMQRAILCAEACEGMADPEKQIESLKRELCNSRTDCGIQYQEILQLKADKAELLTAFKAVLKQANTKHDEIGAHISEGCAFCNARALIAKHTKP